VCLRVVGPFNLNCHAAFLEGSRGEPSGEAPWRLYANGHLDYLFAPKPVLYYLGFARASKHALKGNNPLFDRISSVSEFTTCFFSHLNETFFCTLCTSFSVAAALSRPMMGMQTKWPLFTGLRVDRLLDKLVFQGMDLAEGRSSLLLDAFPAASRVSFSRRRPRASDLRRSRGKVQYRAASIPQKFRVGRF
jgi:hypothetical protein